jgi:hypothetical protein
MPVSQLVVVTDSETAAAAVYATAPNMPPRSQADRASGIITVIDPSA